MAEGIFSLMAGGRVRLRASSWCSAARCSGQFSEVDSTRSRYCVTRWRDRVGKLVAVMAGDARRSRSWHERQACCGAVLCSGFLECCALSQSLVQISTTLVLMAEGSEERIGNLTSGLL